MVSAIFSELTNIVTAFVNLLVSLFDSVVNIFWTAPTSESSTGSLTMVGILMLIALGTSLVFWAIGFIRRLIRVAR